MRAQDDARRECRTTCVPFAFIIFTTRLNIHFMITTLPTGYYP